MKSVSLKSTKVNTGFELKGRRLTKWAAKLLERKFKREAESGGGKAYEDLQPEQKLFIAIVLQAVVDLCSTNELERRRASNYLNNVTGNVEMVCECAGLHHEAVVRAIKRLLSLKGYTVPGDAVKHPKDRAPWLRPVANA